MIFPLKVTEGHRRDPRKMKTEMPYYGIYSIYGCYTNAIKSYAQTPTSRVKIWNTLLYEKVPIGTTRWCTNALQWLHHVGEMHLSNLDGAFLSTDYLMQVRQT